MAATRKYHFDIEPVENSEDLPILARIADEALRHADSIHEVKTRCGRESVYESTLKALHAGLEDSKHFIFKAVKRKNGDSTIIGLTQWTVGFIETPKASPMANSTNEPTPSSDATLVAPVSFPRI